MLNSIKTLKKYCKATLNVFLKIKFLMTKKNYLYDKVFASDQNFTTEHIKIPGFHVFNNPDNRTKFGKYSLT